MKKALFFFLLLLPFVIKAQTIITVAGNGTGGYNGDGIPATAATIGISPGCAIDVSGNIYIADGNNQRIRKVDRATGIISTVAGTGTAGYNGDGIAATAAQLNNPAGVIVDRLGNLYIGDANNVRIRKVDAATGIITTVAGNGILGYTGDGGLADTTEISNPCPAMDTIGNLYIGDNYRIRKVDAFTGIITTICGTGVSGSSGDGGLATAATVNYESGICTDVFGNVYFSDNNSYVVRKISVSTGIINKVAGTYGNGGTYLGDGLQATASHINPFGITVDDTGNLYIADYGNERIEKVDTLGFIHTIAGDGIAGFSGDGGPADSAEIHFPENVTLDICNNIYIVDRSNKRVRKVIFDSTCSYVSDTTHTDTTNAVQNIKSGEFSVYPNPTSKDLTLTLSIPIAIGREGINNVVLYNMLGQAVYDKMFVQQKKITIDISALPNGVYFVKVNPASGGTYVEKVVKE